MVNKWLGYKDYSIKYILDMFPKMENVYLYTITEFTHLFVDIKHMRPVTEMPVVDRTFQFLEIEMPMISEHVKMLILFGSFCDDHYCLFLVIIEILLSIAFWQI